MSHVPSPARPRSEGRRCEVKGDLLYCLEVKRPLTYASVVKGQEPVELELCFGRLSRPTRSWCIRVLADATRVGKEHIEYEEGDTLITVVDEPGDLAIYMDRSGEDKWWVSVRPRKVRVRGTLWELGREVREERWDAY